MSEVMKMATVTYYDPYTIDTALIVANEYGVEITAQRPTGNENEAFISVYGPAEQVDKFIEAVNEDALDVLDNEAYRDDNDYQDWLSEKLRGFGVLYIPKYEAEND